MYRITVLLAFAMILFLKVNSQGNNPPTSVVKECNFDSSHSLDIHDALELIKNYREKRWKRHKRMPLFAKKYDAGSCWFSIEKLHQFTNEVNEKLEEINKILKQTQDSVNCPSPGKKITGFRFYYLVYKKKDCHAPDELKKGNRNTKKIHSLLIVATEKRGTYDTDIIYKDRVAALIISPKDEEFQNEGTLCPPLPKERCQGATLARMVYGNPPAWEK